MYHDNFEQNNIKANNKYVYRRKSCLCSECGGESTFTKKVNKIIVFKNSILACKQHIYEEISK